MQPAVPKLSLRMFGFVVLLAGLVLTELAPAAAADVNIASRKIGNPAPVAALPFARSERAQAVWASGACWSECGSYTAWNLVACLERDRQGRCLRRADTADRSCQRECRSAGGPLLPLDF